MTAATVEDMMDEKQRIKELKRQEQQGKQKQKWQPAPPKYQYPQRSADDTFWLRISFCLIVVNAGFLLYIILGVIGIVGCIR